MRYALRVLGRNPGFTAVAILVLAIGIGANTAVFSVVYNVLLKPLNYRDPDRLVVALQKGIGPVSPAAYLDLKSQATDFEQIEATQAWGGTIETADRAEVVPGLVVTSGMMAMLGVPPERGRWFRQGEDQPGAAPVILISHALWQRRFASDPNIIGRTIRVSAKPFTVIGVMPRGFQFAPFWQTEAEMWAPFDISNRIDDRSGWSVRLFGRLKNGVSMQQAQTQVRTLSARMERLHPETDTGITIEAVPLIERVVGNVRPTLVVLLATAAFVLMIACANIANLLLTRAVARRREIAVRLAIGAGRWQIVRQLATESLLVSALGGIVGVLLAWISLRFLSRLLPVATLPRQGEITMQPAVLAFAWGVSMLAGLAAGLFPALDSSSIEVNENLKEGSRGSTGGRHRRARGVLVAAEVALALVLLVCAGLTMRTLANLNTVDAGFQPLHLLTVQVFEPASYNTGEKQAALYRRISDALLTVPGVERVSAINHLPISGDVWTIDYAVPGRPAPPPGQGPGGVYRVVRPGYFEAMQIPVLRGREFSDRDNAQSAPVIIVNETLARRQWPHEDALGKSLKVHAVSEQATAVFTIVGVIKDVRQSDWTGPVADEFYLPYLQHTSAHNLQNLTFVARTSLDPERILGVAEQRIRSVDPRIAVAPPVSMEQVIADNLWRSRVTAFLLSAFGGIALILAASGTYGVIAYSVRQRTQEIGIRRALGATSTDVLRLAFAESLIPVFGGVAVGLVLALSAARWLTTLLYEVQPSDPATFAGVIGSLVLVACLATAIPAYHALQTNVLTALRHE